MRRLRGARTSAAPSSPGRPSFSCPSRILLASALTLNHDPHAAGGPFDNLYGALEIGGVQIGHFLLSNFRQLLARDLSNLVLLRHAGSLDNASRFLKQIGSRWSLHDEGK